MKHSLFSENMKLADLLLANYRLLYVFPYFDISLGFGETTVKQACEKRGISISFFLLVCNVYSFDNYRPDDNTLKDIKMADLICYLKNSHKDYLENRIPHIIAHVMELVSCCPIKHGEMLVEFCEKYKEDVTAHFNYEEKVIFPYITNLLNGVKGENPPAKMYEGSYVNLESALHDLKNIIIKYLPTDDSIRERRTNVLIYLFLFEADLNKHTLLEDKILTPLVDYIEKNS